MSQSNKAYEFSLTPVTKNNIPPLDVLLTSANSLLASTVHWPPGETFHNELVQTFSKKASSGPGWHGRISYHPAEQGTFQEFWDVIGVRHYANREEYVPELVSATYLEPYLDGDYEGWTLHYSYSPPFSPRTFTVLVATSLDDKPPRQGWVVSIPFDVGDNEGLKALEENGVRGKFTTIERLMEVDDKVEWMAATTYQVGGSIPDFLSERKMPRQLAERVPQVLEYISAKRAGHTGRKPKANNRSLASATKVKSRQRSTHSESGSATGNIEASKSSTTVNASATELSTSPRG